MEFKKISARQVLWVLSAALLLLVIFCINHKPRKNVIPDDQFSSTVTLPTVLSRPVVIEGHPKISLPHNKTINPLNKFTTENDDEGQKELNDQMDADRNQQRQIKMLRMQLEQANLQLENEKTMAEINKLKREDANYVKDLDPQGDSGLPNIRIIYIGGAEAQKEAILSIAGINYSVKENDKPLENMKVLSIKNNSVQVHFTAPKEMTATINYIQE